jgi:hypothetical protein
MLELAGAVSVEAELSTVSSGLGGCETLAQANNPTLLRKLTL